MGEGAFYQPPLNPPRFAGGRPEAAEQATDNYGRRLYFSTTVETSGWVINSPLTSTTGGWSIQRVHKSAAFILGSNSFALTFSSSVDLKV